MFSFLIKKRFFLCHQLLHNFCNIISFRFLLWYCFSIGIYCRSAQVNALYTGTHPHSPTHYTNNGKRNQSVSPYTLIKRIQRKINRGHKQRLCRLREKSLVLLMYNDGLSQESPEEGQSARTSEVQSQRQCCISPWLLC